MRELAPALAEASLLAGGLDEKRVELPHLATINDACCWKSALTVSRIVVSGGSKLPLVVEWKIESGSKLPHSKNHRCARN